MKVSYLDPVVAGIKLNENGLSSIGRSVGHGAVDEKIVKEKDVAGFGLQRSCPLERIPGQHFRIGLS